MENASKALIIAAAILIAIVLISLGVMVLGQGSQLVKNADMSEAEITAYNQPFEQYKGKNVRGTNVVQLKNKVEQHNRTYADDASKKITWSGPDSIGTGYAYEVSFGYDDGGLVNKVTVTQVTTTKTNTNN